MFENEVIISEADKEQALHYIQKVNEILDPYAYSAFDCSIPTNMSRAKHSARMAEKWIECLCTDSRLGK